MATTIIAPGNFRDYSSCRVKITVTGGCHQGMVRKGSYTKTVPYSSLSQIIQGIHRLGGKITHITFLNSQTLVSPIDCTQQPLSTIAATDIQPSAQPQAQNHPDETSELIKPTTVQPEQQVKPIAAFDSGDYAFTDEW